MSAELSEETILDSYGGLLWTASCAFSEDLRYLTEMVDSANLIEYKRRLWEARSEAVKQAKTPDEVRELTREIMRERGVVAPGRRRR